MKIKDINPESVKALTTQQLMETHRKLHMLYSGAKKRGLNNPEYYKLLQEKHVIVIAEMQRRGFRHLSPLSLTMPRNLYESISYDLSVRSIRFKYQKILQKTKEFYLEKKKQLIQDFKEKRRQFLKDLKNELLLGRINKKRFEEKRSEILEELETTFLGYLDDYKIAERQSIDRIARQEATEVVRTAQKINIDDVLEKGIQSYYKTMKVVTIATAVIIISNKIYRDYFSISGRACSGRVGLDREKCIKEFKRQAMGERIKYIQANMEACQKDKDPEKCMRRLNSEIGSLKAQLSLVRL